MGSGRSASGCLRCCVRGSKCHGLRKEGERAGWTARPPGRDVEAALAAGLTREAGSDELTDELVARGRGGPHGSGQTSTRVVGEAARPEEQIRARVKGDGEGREPLSILKDRVLADLGGARVDGRCTGERRGKNHSGSPLCTVVLKRILSCTTRSSPNP
jgi:hypothetical protein